MIKTTSWHSQSQMLVGGLWYTALARIVQKVGVFFLPVRRVTSAVLLIQSEGFKATQVICPSCNGYNLRDENAKNILQEGLRLLVAVGTPETQNACGELVRPGAIQARSLKQES